MFHLLQLIPIGTLQQYLKQREAIDILNSNDYTFFFFLFSEKKYNKQKKPKPVSTPKDETGQKPQVQAHNSK